MSTIHGNEEIFLLIVYNHVCQLNTFYINRLELLVVFNSPYTSHPASGFDTSKCVMIPDSSSKFMPSDFIVRLPEGSRPVTKALRDRRNGIDTVPCADWTSTWMQDPSTSTSAMQPMVTSHVTTSRRLRETPRVNLFASVQGAKYFMAISVYAWHYVSWLSTSALIDADHCRVPYSEQAEEAATLADPACEDAHAEAVE
uniref:Predicted protein n=1 Tax=Physcomitrium patens TaxID=3218 RepID=A9U6J9_PHYPA